MKIAILSTINSGGAGLAARNLQLGFLQAGLDCTFLSVEEPMLSGDFGLSIGGNSHFSISRLFRHWGTLSSPDKLAAGVNELYSDLASFVFKVPPSVEAAIRDADIVNIHWASGCLYSPDLLELLAGKKIILTLHDMRSFTGGCHYHATCARFKNSCGRCPFLGSSNDADLSSAILNAGKEIFKILQPTVISPSQWLADMAGSSSALGSCPIHVVPNIHDVAAFFPINNEERIKLRARYGIPAEKAVVLVGVADPTNLRKNLPLFLDAWKHLFTENPSFPAVLMTFGKWLPEDATSIPNLICSAGFIDDRKRLAELYNCADLFVSPSLLDNLSNTLCEAQSCGTPVLCFDFGGNKETHVPGESGFLIKNNSVDALANGISSALQHPSLQTEMREKARVFAERTFAANQVVNQYVAIISAMPTNTQIISPPKEVLYELQKWQMSTLYEILAADLTRLSADLKKQNDENESLKYKMHCLAEEVEKMQCNPFIGWLRFLRKLLFQK